MEKKRWALILMALCLALVFSVSSVEAQKNCNEDDDAYVKDTGKCRRLIGTDWQSDPTIFILGIDCDDNDDTIGGPPCGGGDDGDTKTSKKSIPLRMTFDEMEVYGECVDNICSDIDGDYIDNEDRVRVSAAEHSQPNPAAGIHMGLGAKPRIMRQLFLNIICEPIEHDPDGDGIPNILIDNCIQLPEMFDIETRDFLGRGFSGLFPDCGGVISSCDLGAAVRPYKVDCPEGDQPCPDVFTMDPSTLAEPNPVLMSFRLFFGGSFTVEVASAIGADGSQDPGTCLSMLTEDQLDVFLDEHCRDDPNDPDDPGPADCNVSVTAFDMGAFPGDGTGAGVGDGENDAWRVVADDVTALICDRPGVTVLGKATLTFGFDAIKKE